MVISVLVLPSLVPVLCVCDGAIAMGLGGGCRKASSSQRIVAGTLIFLFRLCSGDTTLLARWWYENQGVTNISLSFPFQPQPSPLVTIYGTSAAMQPCEAIGGKEDAAAAASS